MALISCDECSSEISDKAANCPNCGNPITESERMNVVVTDNSATTALLAVSQKKSMGVALILTILFGPLGLLYATVPGGLVLLLLTFVIGIATLGVGFLFGWIVSIIWAVIAVNSHNEKIMRALGALNN